MERARARVAGAWGGRLGGGGRWEGGKSGGGGGGAIKTGRLVGKGGAELVCLSGKALGW